MCPECEQLFCPECFAVIEDADTSCPNCGTEFEFACPDCGNEVDPEDEVCAICGALISGAGS
jgi:predicted amidophosphoribosyltransferase